MNRTERRRKKYNQLRDAGFTNKEATKLKDHSWQRVNHYCVIGKQLKDCRKRLLEGKK